VPTIIQNGNTLTCTVAGIAYSWYLNGILQPQYTTQTIVITATQQGIWQVEVVSASLPYCSGISNGIQVGINELMSDGNLIVFPNPADRELRIKNAELKIKEVEILNVYGKSNYQ